MALLPHEIKITTEHRQIAITKGDHTERLGFFHKWSEKCGEDYALIENTDGQLEYIHPEVMRFLPIGNEMAPKELEKTYREIGILKEGVGE